MKRSVQRFARVRKLRRRSPWTLMIGGALAASTAAARPAVAAPVLDVAEGQTAGVAAGDSQVLSFNISAGPLEDAIKEFQRITGLMVILSDPSIATVQSPGAIGSLTPAAAMDALLRGTLVRPSFAADAVRLDISTVAEFVSVEGQTTRVTSPKYTAPARETPQTIVVIPQQVMNDQGAASLREVLRNTPGITMSIGEGVSGTVAFGDQVMIRGFSARNDIYIDGARDTGEVSRDMFNTEAVEVAKGPTSVTAGRGSTGGSINLVTKTPLLQDAGAVRMTFGTADHKRTTFDVNRRLNRQVALRVNGLWQDAGYAGRDVQLNRSWGFAPSLTLGLASPTRVTVSYSRLKQDNIPDVGMPTLFPDNAVAEGLTVNDLDFSNYYGLAARDHENTTSDVASVIVERVFTPTLKARNLTRYGKHFRDSIVTAPRPTFTTVGLGPEDPGYDATALQMRRSDAKYANRDDRVVTNQTDLTSTFRTGAVGHSADLGLEISREHQPVYAVADAYTNGRPPVVDLLNPDPFTVYRPALFRTGASSNAHMSSAAVYLFDTVTIGPRWQADLGVRWDHIDIDYRTVAANGAIADFGRTDQAFTGRSGLVFKPTARGSIYGAFSTSFAPAYDGTHGLTVAATGANSEALAPERSRNYEVGTKWGLARSLEMTAAVFRMEKINAKTTDVSGATVLSGDQEVKGVELGLSGNITDRWGAFAGMAIMDGKVNASGIATEVGQRLAYIPRASLNLWTTYRFPTGLTLGGGTNYSKGHYFNQTGGFLFVSNRFDTRYVDNAAAIQALTRYWVFNAVAVYPLNRHIQIQVNANNLADTKYADRAYDRHFLPGPGRQLLVAPTISF